MGRKSQLETLPAADLETYLKAIRLGIFPSVAARLIGVPPKTVARWIYEGESGNPTYADFALAVRQAEATGEKEYLSQFLELVTNGEVEPRDRIKGYTWLFERRYGWTLDKADGETSTEEKFKTHVVNVNLKAKDE